jgi:dimeric dUTPase (all-alpha-NTP-PPase superfamily)
MDKLDTILKIQAELQERIYKEKLGKDFHNLTAKETSEMVKDNVHWVVEELHEMTREMSHMKHWKNYDNLTEQDITRMNNSAKKEFIDVVHFMFNIALLLGMDADMLFDMYLEKSSINHTRQDTNY